MAPIKAVKHNYSFTEAAPISFVAQFVDAADRDTTATQTRIHSDVIGALPLRVIDTTGGDFDLNYSVSNIVSCYDNVYCAKKNHCTVVFAIEARAGLLQEINVVTPPHTGYTSPVQHIAVFVAMYKDGLTQRVDKYFSHSPVRHLFTPEDSSLAQRPTRDTTMHTAGYPALENWNLFARELAPRDEESESCVADYHLCYPSYRPDANNCGLVLDVGGRERVRSVTKLSTSGESCPGMGACDGPRSGRSSGGMPTTSHSLIMVVPKSKWNRDGPLEPLALATIPRSSQYRHVRIRFDHAVCGRYLAVRFSNSTVRGNSNVDIESFSVRGVIDPGAAEVIMI